MTIHSNRCAQNPINRPFFGANAQTKEFHHMHRFIQKLYTFSCRFIQFFSFVLALLLFLGCFLSTCYSTDMVSQQVLTRLDNPLWNLAGVSTAVIHPTDSYLSYYRRWGLQPFSRC